MRLTTRAKNLIAVSFGSVIVSGLTILIQTVPALSQETATIPSPAITVTQFHIPECPTEDSDNCIWNAETQGNGKGQSFISYQGKLYYSR